MEVNLEAQAVHQCDACGEEFKCSGCLKHYPEHCHCAQNPGVDEHGHARLLLFCNPYCAMDVEEEDDADDYDFDPFVYSKR